MYFETCFGCAASGPGLFPAFWAPASSGGGLFGQPGAHPFGKGLSFRHLLLGSSFAAAAPTSSSGGVGGFGQQNFAASQASGVTILLQCL